MAFFAGWLFSVALPAFTYWGPVIFAQVNDGQRTAFVVTSLAYLCAHSGAKHLLSSFPGGRSLTLVGAQVLVFYAIFTIGTLILRVDVSRALLLASGAAALIWFYIEYTVTRRYFRPKFAVLPGGFADSILLLKECDARRLESLSLLGTRYDGVVADFEVIGPEQERFLTRCALEGVPVYNAKTVYETITGRVKIHRMSENNLGSLLPSPGYELVKSIYEKCIVLLSLPLIIPFCLVVAIIIKLDSNGPVIFSQTRVGKGNRPFRMFKFRTMRWQAEATDQFASECDPRITRVGRVLRRLRIDEVPQFINVLAGDMSLIGPRPEQRSFVNSFENEIPFYSYRHVVKPGITGWAQVRYGYAASSDETHIKIEHDFYYIKNCSLALDFFIILLTIKTMVTGFGSR